MTNHQTGHDAEKVAAQYLQELGFKIRGLNWRTKYCEIDIVAEKKKIIYFVEVKYRQSDAYGGGFEHVTRKKLQRMQFAAEMWVAQNEWTGDCQLAVAEVSGASFQAIRLLVDL